MWVGLRRIQVLNELLLLSHDGGVRTCECGRTIFRLDFMHGMEGFLHVRGVGSGIASSRGYLFKSPHLIHFLVGSEVSQQHDSLFYFIFIFNLSSILYVRLQVGNLYKTKCDISGFIFVRL